LAVQFDTMYNKKAYLHWYTGEGMDLQEFDESVANVRDLIGEYQMRGDYEYDDLPYEPNTDYEEEIPSNGHLE
jgi:tubulin beta